MDWLWDHLIWNVFFFWQVFDLKRWLWEYEPKRERDTTNRQTQLSPFWAHAPHLVRRWWPTVQIYLHVHSVKSLRRWGGPQLSRRRRRRRRCWCCSRWRRRTCRTGRGWRRSTGCSWSIKPAATRPTTPPPARKSTGTRCSWKTSAAATASPSASSATWPARRLAHGNPAHYPSKKAELLGGQRQQVVLPPVEEGSNGRGEVVSR